MLCTAPPIVLCKQLGNWRVRRSRAHTILRTTCLLFARPTGTFSAATLRRYFQGGALYCSGGLVVAMAGDEQLSLPRRSWPPEPSSGTEVPNSPVSASSAPTPRRCAKCLSEESDATAADSGGQRRWGATDACWWCEKAGQVLSQGPKEECGGDAEVVQAWDWHTLSTAFVMMHIEGCVVDRATLMTRFRVMSKILAALRTTGMRSSAGEAGSSSASEASESLRRPLNLAPPVPDFRTPQKRRSGCVASPPPPSASSTGYLLSPASSASASARTTGRALAPAPDATPLPPELARRVQTPGGPQRPAPARELSPARRHPDGDGGAPGIAPMSMYARLPQGMQSIARIRETIHLYVQRLATMNWYQSFKNNTFKALERRFVAHEPEVTQTGNIQLIDGYMQPC